MAITATAPQLSATYSKVGGELAKQAMSSYDRATQWTDADRFIGSGLQSIVSNEGATADEKALASMGLAMGNHQMQWQNSAQARYATANAIASCSGGPIGAVLADATSRAFGPCNKWPDADMIVFEGLQAIESNPNASELSHDLAALGRAMGSHQMDYQNSANAREAVIKEIAYNPQGSTPNILANVSIEAYNLANKWPDADNIAGDGLRAVMNNAHSSDVQKAVAKAALDQTTMGGITWQDSARARVSALQQLASEQ